MAKGISSTLMIMVLVIVVLLILLFAYYAKGTGLFSKIADQVLSLSSKFLPTEPRTELKQNEKLPQKAIDTQNNFINSLKSSMQIIDNNVCRIQSPSLSGMGDLGFELSNLNNNINSKITKIKSGEGYLALNIKTISNARICLINQQNFFNCYQSSDRNCQGQIYNEADIINIQNGKAIINKNSYDLADSMVRIDNNKFCFVPLYDSQMEKALNREIPECGKKLENQVINDKDKSATEEFYRFVSFLQDLNSNHYDKFCIKNFHFNTNKLVQKYYIYMNPNGQIDLRYNEQGGRIVQRADINYIPYGDILDESLLNTYFNDYDTFKDTFVISPAGDYSTSDKSVQTNLVQGITAVSKDNKWFLSIPNFYLNKQPACS